MGKVLQMQPMWLCLVMGKGIAETYGNTLWKKAQNVQFGRDQKGLMEERFC